ncbi:hypothetical protein [Flammeovirga aprica]|uniref:Uncharacterized protein n=1 Tax=Flammeovirga aprica JL-4 TaxID=694437 RepID=A0A7X9S117_9BACT|nr:hypothetical protein [Flammeovirga aprica]NME72398.1 hypothetical protein [Flammeovirga aprica JL-4]
MNTNSYSKSFYYFVGIVLLWIPILFFDSPYFYEHYFDGKILTTISVFTIFGVIFYMSSLRIRFLMLMMVPLSWLGEMLCSEWLDMYDYRGNQIPIYVPFGHAVIFALGWNITQKSPILSNALQFKKWMMGFYILLFGIITLYFKDTLSLALGILFFWALWRRNYMPFYLVMSALVLYLEVIGTYYGVWRWDQKQWIFQTVNPPIGAMFIYIGGDMILGRLCRYLLKIPRKKRSKLAQIP